MTHKECTICKLHKSPDYYHKDKPEILYAAIKYLAKHKGG